MYPAPSWADDSHVVWPETGTDASDASYAIVYKATDLDGAFGNNLEHEVLMTCQGATHPLPPKVNQVVLKNGILYMTVSAVATSSPLTLWRLAPVNGEYRCDTTSSANSILFAGSSPMSFELSPDGSKILFFAYTAPGAGEFDTTAVMVGSTTAGSTPAALVPQNGATNVGPRWVAGGRQVIWSKTVSKSTTSGTGGSTTTYNRPVSSGLWIVNADGSSMRQLTSYSSTSTQARAIHTGYLGGCGIGRPGPSHSASWFAVTALFGLAGFGRRRLLSRRSSRKSVIRTAV
jgi:hypothetical protein